jgi:hypothetical protein
MSAQENVSFPMYRTLPNGRSLYKILSVDAMEEIQRVGSKLQLYRIQAVQYPEKLLISDMIQCVPPYESCDERAFEELRSTL